VEAVGRKVPAKLEAAGRTLQKMLEVAEMMAVGANMDLR
jgi:hypothetical protein